MEPEPGQDRRRERASSDLLQVAEKAPVTQLVNMILLDALKRSASDIHVEPLEDRLRIRYRIDGVLYEQSSPPKHIEESLVSRLKVMARMDIAERRLPQDGTARVRVGEREIDVRVSTVPVAEGERVVLRLLDRESALLPLSCLGMSDEVLVGFRRLLAMPHGMVVVAGPTGSGKTTTLYASLRELDSTRRNILTVEDPVEYQLPDIGQIQVKPKIGLTFAAGLRHILRQDPDVVLVGETRDIETAEIAVRASLTGHLVFTTLHTNDAAGSVLRMVDMGVEPYLLASCLRGVLAQRLVRRLCPSCRREAVPAGADIDRAGPEADLLRGRSVWEPVGCPGCMDGFRGRVGLFEFLAFSESLAGHIRGGEAGAARLKGAAQEAGMSSLLKDGIGKVSAGATSLAEVLSAAT
jgi:general secretion pathway protein E